MADYGTDINLFSWLYRQPVYYTNPLDYDREDVIIRMVLDSSNFNFTLAKSDLGDLRVAENFDGTNVLRMWIAYLDLSKPYTSIYFKLSKLLASQTITLWAFFGNSSATLVNEPDKIGFIFYETFDTSPLSSNKWTGNLTSWITNPYGYYLDRSVSGAETCHTITNPLLNVPSWIMEAGTYLNGARYSSGNYTVEYSHAFSFSGENNFYITYITGDGVGADVEGITHNIVIGSLERVLSSTQCAEPYSYQENFIAYDKFLDVVYQRSLDRNTFPDTINLLYRKIHGDTALTNVHIYGWYSAFYVGSSSPTYISWLVVRPFDVGYRALVDCSELYATTQDRQIEHQLIDHNEYSDDITNVLYEHESSFGGDPLLLSDDSINTTWVSDVDAILETEISIIINFGSSADLTSNNYTHYDSDHVKYFGASKLSEDNNDVWGRNFWDYPTTTSGWAAIDFGSKIVINSCRITAVSNDLDSCPKNYIFYGSNYIPTTDLDKAQILHSGIFGKINSAQQFFFNNKAEYRYYILYIVNNYGGSNIRIQEWEMYNILFGGNKKRVSQLRLLPPTDELLYSFPNEISLQASVDNLNWDTLIPWTQTYSPYVQHYVMYGYWQHYSFTDASEKGYWLYRLLCRGNWGEASGKIAIKEWEMCELVSEYNKHRILDGTSDIIKQIWASENCGIGNVNGIIYATNDRLNYIINDSVFSVSLPQNYNDIKVV